MRGLQAVRTVFVFEMKREWFGVVVTTLFALYFGIVFVFTVHPGANGEPAVFMSGMRDWVYLFSFPLFGCLMHRTVFHYWRHDPFTKRIAHFRTMPVPVAAIVGARYAQSLLMQFLAGGMFLAWQFIVSTDLQKLAGIGQWIAAGLVWIGYGMLVQTFYIYLELGCSGKTFVLYYAAYTAAMGAAGIALGLAHESLFLDVLRAVQRYPVMCILAVWVAAALAARIGRRLTMERMRRRRYTF